VLAEAKCPERSRRAIKKIRIILGLFDLWGFAKIEVFSKTLPGVELSLKNLLFYGRLYSVLI